MSKVIVTLLSALAVALAPQALAQQPKKAKPELNKQDRAYLRQMLRTDLAEVRAARLAGQRAISDPVKQFAAHMLQEHGKHADETRKLAKEKRVDAPSQPTEKQREALKKLESLAMLPFDQAYMKQMVEDHEDALKLVREVADKAKDKELRAAAEKSVPVIRKHLEMARSIAPKLQ